MKKEEREEIELLQELDEALEMQCPRCGYYCLGEGGEDCIDKLGLVKIITGKLDKITSTSGYPFVEPTEKLDDIDIEKKIEEYWAMIKEQTESAESMPALTLKISVWLEQALKQSVEAYKKELLSKLPKKDKDLASNGYSRTYNTAIEEIKKLITNN